MNLICHATKKRNKFAFQDHFNKLLLIFQSNGGPTDPEFPEACNKTFKNLLQQTIIF